MDSGLSSFGKRTMGVLQNSDAHHAKQQISNLSDENLESHLLLELEVTICGVNTSYLIDNRSLHNFIDYKTLDQVGLVHETSEILEITLADGSKIEVNKVCYVPVQFSKGIRQIVLCYMVASL